MLSEYIYDYLHTFDAIFVKKTTHTFATFITKTLTKSKNTSKNHILCVIKASVLKESSKMCLSQNQPLKTMSIGFITK